ncbi:NrfD/PsrC family molybdoenzyme membrane anchor subunit [Kallotenue papyrolyticum]|uniref:NrfD/PsrC family molybdoenzyme membrane anchor subunit n=1 Tax=Kallotenue papyrolyticum TaxID=1325125 RepID=UPI0004785964|nr:NrfD/PsrC family molybdoenzyme membrane anchor subunit [Kallotenue papyrolyticum]
MIDQRIVENPHWNWMIVLYFFLGGLAGGLAFIGALAALFGGARMQPVVRWAALLSFPLTASCGILLILDLKRPERFWHMLIQSETLRPMFKYWSPISYGSWMLLIFSLLTGISFVAALVGMDRRGRLRRLEWLPRLLGGGPLGVLLQVLLLIFGYLFASYTGSLATATNLPIWSDTPLLGALFFVSGVSTALATLMLLLLRGRASHELLLRLEDADRWAILLELALLVIFAVLLGNLLLPLLATRYGLVLVIGTLLLGLLIPLALQLVPGVRRGTALLSAVLVLIGGFALRYALIYVGQEIVIAGR